MDINEALGFLLSRISKGTTSTWDVNKWAELGIRLTGRLHAALVTGMCGPEEAAEVEAIARGQLAVAGS